MKAGIGKVEITPPLGTELWGYGFYLNRKAVGINDNLYAKAIEFDDGKNKAIIISCDLGGLGRNFVQKCKEEISSSINVPKDNISICAIHTHSGPATVYLKGLGEVDEDYLLFLKEKIVEVAKKADKDIEEVQIGAEIGEVDIGYNRVDKNGLVDKSLVVFRVDKMNKETKAIVYNYSAHPVNGGGRNLLISADWPGYANKKIEKEKKCVSIFLQGSCGDIDVKNAGICEKAEENGEEVAREVLKTCEKIKLKKDMEIKMKTKIINLPLHIPTEKEIEDIVEIYKEVRQRNEKFEGLIQEWKRETLKEIHKNPRDLLPTEVQVLQIGKDIIFVMQPSELFTKWGLKIKEISNSKSTFVVGYANDYIGYIPDKEDFKHKIGGSFHPGYAALMVPIFSGFFHFKEDVGEVLVNEINEIVRYFQKQ